MEVASLRRGCGASVTKRKTSASRSLTSPVLPPTRAPKGKRTNRPCIEPPPSTSAKSASNIASTCGYRAPNNETGTIRCGLMVKAALAPKATSLSPPKPMVRTSIARTIVRQPPTSAPSWFTRGRPSHKTPKSVVVPPISDMMKLCKPDNHCAPTKLAAGPESTVSIGRVATLWAKANVPSPLTIISGHLIPNSAIERLTASINIDTREINLALSAAVSARRGASREDDNSVDKVTGLFDKATMMSRA